MLLRLLPRATRIPSLRARSFASAPVGLIDDLTYRGYIQDITTPQFLHAALESGQQTVYAGIDPTARALHVGHLLPLMCLLHFHVRGHHIIPLIGGATGLIGDPSGRSTERDPAETETTAQNTAALVESVTQFFKRASLYADERIVLDKDKIQEIHVQNNIEWHQNVSMMDFLRNVGVYSRVNTMLNRESVRTRLESQHGISFTEFTYQLLQAYDFYHLHQRFGCSIQVGGSDQWGNILGGISLINRINARNPDAPPAAFGLTTPLLTSSTGVKFGKSAGNAVWLDPELTSVFNFYQYFVKTPDTEVESYLKLMTLLSWTEISDIMSAHKLQPHQRIAQRRLASELTELVHFKSGRASAEMITKLMFQTDLYDIKATDIVDAFDGDRCVHMVDPEELFNVSVVKLAVKYGLAPSTTAARVLVLSRGLYYNNRPVPELQFTLRQMHLIDGRLAILKAGKDKLAVLVAKSS
ncbi:tyrosine-tRNA ligase [Mycena latifolia]|nr:tyrosine-tRNA ligase [Mycena latifolia]